MGTEEGRGHVTFDREFYALYYYYRLMALREGSILSFLSMGILSRD